MKKESSAKIKLGLFIATGAALLIVSMYLIGDKQRLFGSNFHLKARFKNVSGLQKGNNVRFSGIDVGTVKDIKIINDTSILVEMAIDQKVREFIKADALATIGTDGLMGNKLINIGPGSPSAGTINEHDVLPSLTALSSDEILRELEQTNVNAGIITHHLAEVVQKINKGEGAVGKLLADNDLAQDVDQTIRNLQTLTQKINEISIELKKDVDEINFGEGTVVSMLKDTALVNQIENAVGDFSQASTNSEEVTSGLKTLIDKIKEGEGAAGTVLVDTVFARDLQNSLKNIEQGSKAFSENMEALKHNFLLRGYFRKQEKGSKKSE